PARIGTVAQWKALVAIECFRSSRGMMTPSLQEPGEREPRTGRRPPGQANGRYFFSGAILPVSILSMAPPILPVFIVPVGPLILPASLGVSSVQPGIPQHAKRAEAARTVERSKERITRLLKQSSCRTEGA